MSIAHPWPPVSRVVLVERYLSDPTPKALGSLAADAAAAARHLAAAGTRIAYLGSTVVPDDELAFCLFATEDASAPLSLMLGLRTPPLRVVQALTTRPGTVLQAAGRPPV